MLGAYLDKVRKETPLVHNITNYVTVNDVANVILAAGASPIMSDEAEDVEDIVSICGGLNINIGTLNRDTINGMFAAGRKARDLGKVRLLDPVGAGASRLRTETAFALAEEIGFTCIRGNISEIKSLIAGTGTTKGVDADTADAVTESNIDLLADTARRFAEKRSCIVVITGAIDLVSDGDICYVIKNGRSEMSKITGTGCQLSGLITAFIAASPSEKVHAAASAVACMGYAGEIAWKNMLPSDGNATYRNRIIDAVYNMTGTGLDQGARYEIK